MKTLSSCTTEGISKTIKDQLMEIINSESFTEEQAQYIIDRWNASNNLDRETLNRVLAEKGITVQSHVDHIYEMFHSHSDILAEITSEEYKKLHAHNIAHKDNIVKNNLYTQIKGVFDNKNIDGLLKRVAEYNPTQTVTRGYFEILLQLFLSDITPGNSGVGDVNCNGEFALEIKSPNARIKGLYDCDIQKANKEIVRLLGAGQEQPKRIFEIQKTIKSFFKRFVDELDTKESKQDFQDKVLTALCAQFDLDVKTIEELIDNAKDIDIFKGDLYDNIVKLMGCIQLYFYAKHYKFSHLVVFKGRSKRDCINNGDYICIPNSVCLSISEIYKNTDLEFKVGGRSEGKDATRGENFCHIFYR